MARQKPNDLKKSVAKRPDNPDPQREHERQLKNDGKPDPNEGADAVKRKVEVLGEGVTINGHPLHGRTGGDDLPVSDERRGDVIELSEDDIATHREHGVRLADVPDDFAGEIYNVSEPWKNPDNVED